MKLVINFNGVTVTEILMNLETNENFLFLYLLKWAILIIFYGIQTNAYEFQSWHQVINKSKNYTPFLFFLTHPVLEILQANAGYFNLLMDLGQKWYH